MIFNVMTFTVIIPILILITITIINHHRSCKHVLLFL